MYSKKKMNFNEIHEIFKKYIETISLDEKYYGVNNEIKLIIDIKSFIYTFSFYEKLLKSNKFIIESIKKKFNKTSKEINKNFWWNIKEFLKEKLRKPYELDPQNIILKDLEFYIKLRNNLIHDCNFKFIIDEDYSKISSFNKYNNFFIKLLKKFKINIIFVNSNTNCNT